MWDVLCRELLTPLISFRVLRREEDGAILEVDVLELDLDKLTYPTSKLKDELQYELIS